MKIYKYSHILVKEKDIFYYLFSDFIFYVRGHIWNHRFQKHSTKTYHILIDHNKQDPENMVCIILHTYMVNIINLREKWKNETVIAFSLERGRNDRRRDFYHWVNFKIGLTTATWIFFIKSRNEIHEKIKINIGKTSFVLHFIYLMFISCFYTLRTKCAKILSSVLQDYLLLQDFWNLHTY